jgi:hypothetical protein
VKIAGKFARINNGSTAVVGPFRWTSGFKRERLDVTTFESTVSASGNNVFSDGLTGVLDSIFTIEGWIDDTTINLFFPDASQTNDFLFRKNVSLGYKGVNGDILDFGPATGVREAAKFTSTFQSNGLVPLAA